MRVDLHNAEGKRRRRARLFLVGAPIASALAAGGLTFWACDGRIAVGEWMRRHGHHAVELRTPWLAALADLPGSWFRAAPAPQIDLGISFRNLQLLRAAREAALRAGYLSSASKQSVPATVTVGGATTRCKVRLKGDHLDHILGRKVSMRVQATDGPAMLGMRAFSLQTPPSKGFQLEALFHESVRHCGLLAPRYEFARVACNGDDFGLMAVEEHVAPELFAAQGRRDGPVVRLQEEPMFEAQARLRSSDPDEVVLDDYRTAAVETIGSTAHPEQEPAALALLRAFVAGTLAPAQVFAVDELAGYLAICELWGAWHALRWHNLRFHFDPATGRLAPIGFDANLNMRRPVGQLVTPEEPIVLRMLSDPEVFAAFRRRLAALCAEVQGGTLLQRIAEVDARCRAILRGEYWFLQAFPLDELRARAAWLATLQDGSFRARAADAGLVPLLVSEVADGDFRVRNRTPWEVVVHGARWVDAAGHAVPAELPADWRPFRMIPPRPDEGPIPEVALRLPRPNAALQLEVEARIAMVSERHWARAMPQPLPAHAPALPETSAGELVARHPWLTVEDDGRTLRVARGRHRVERTVVVPRGLRLVAGAGTELVFAADAALVVQGPALFEGSEHAPVQLGAADADGWLGIAVLAPDAESSSRWQHVVVRDARGARAGPLDWRAGVILHGGRAELQDVLLSGCDAGAALCAERTALTAAGLRVERAAGDGVRALAVRGTIADCACTDVGGDALALHAAQVEVRGGALRRVGRGLVASGRGRVDAAGLRVDGAALAIASVDGAVLRLADTEVGNVRDLAAGAWRARPDAAPSELTAIGLRSVDGTPLVVRAQHGCSLVLDGSAVPGEERDAASFWSEGR